MGFVLKRVYDEATADDGYRVLVDRLWPRGLTKQRAALDLWLKDVAPSLALRTAWHHDSDWEAHAAAYRRELQGNAAIVQLRDLAATHPRVTLLYAAHDPVRNHARVLADFLAGLA